VEDQVRAKAKAYGRQAAEMMLHPEQVFRGFLVSTLECQDCLHTSQCVESFLDLSLPVMADKVKFFEYGSCLGTQRFKSK
jgi:ubiquitin carboxyl-terminal hydrolase 16/45